MRPLGHLWSLLRDPKGNVLLYSMVLGTAGLVSSVAVMQMGLDISQLSSREVTYWHAQHANQRALTLGGYFVVNNLVACRQAGWGAAALTKCRWGGDLRDSTAESLGQASGSPSIAKSEFPIIDEGVKDGAYYIKIRSKFDQVSTETTLIYDIVDWSTNQQMRELIGMIPNSASSADDDMMMVLLRASTPYRAVDGEQLTDLVTTTGIRRPLGTPVLDVMGSPFCNFSCQAGVTEDPNPDCRSSQTVREGTRASVPLRVLNLGPGIIYDLAYEKLVRFNDVYYGNKPDLREAVNIMTGKSFMLPGTTIEHVDVMECPNPSSFQVRNLASESDRVTQNTSYETIFNYGYELNIARYGPQPNWNTYDPFNKATYTPNQTLSKIEPKKSSGILLPPDRPAWTQIPAPPPPQPPASSGDGDGDGDGGGGNN